MTELLTIPQLARLAKQHRATIYKRIAAGDIAVVYPRGSHRARITAAEAERYMSGGHAILTPSTPQLNGGSRDS